ncbi:conjugal transfer protein TraW [Pseudomonas fulva]|uniref:conjugal transfer protein TraW n=1 Tax=Pseudomonas fulva TaxID=47880 RepID=UPI002DB6819F|nr:conjugal transfer protein TraW [Pseudomonas fulva]MEB8059268.1 conjugal transfer protein TraW [Pseudomonas fulva]
MHARIAAAVITTGLLAANQASASIVPVAVTSSIPISMQVVPAMTTMQGTLSTMEATLSEILSTEMQIGTAIVQASDKQVTAITEAAQAQRQQDIFGRQTDRLERAREGHTVADSICSESASEAAPAASRGTRSGASTLSTGGGVKNAAVRKSVASEPVTASQGGYRSALVHAAYCSTGEAEVIGGTTLCPVISMLPGGDTELRSLVDGAGEVGKSPDLTFNQDQIDAAMAYLKNSAKHDIGRAPGKGEVESVTGREYQGLMTQYKSIQSAATQPQLDMIAASKANPDIKDALMDALRTPSASAYFMKTASKEALRTGNISEREFERFEVGRRYASTFYQSDLQAMTQDNLLREVVRTVALGNWLQLGIKDELRKANILAGQELALSAEQKYKPQIERLSKQMSAGVSANAN